MFLSLQEPNWNANLIWKIWPVLKTCLHIICWENEELVLYTVKPQMILFVVYDGHS